jgi:hypothetical protein
VGGPKVHKLSGGRAQGSQATGDERATFCALSWGRRWDIVGTRKDKNMKIEKNNFVVTFKTEKEVSDYIGMHIPEEQRLLWLGFFIANNYIAQKLEDDGIELVKKK